MVCVVFGVGLVVRAALVPITHGQDFVVGPGLIGDSAWHQHLRAPSALPARRVRILPLVLYRELPFQWLAHQTALPQTLGKILARRALGDRAIAAGTALFFLNPLVLYNGAFYGRFDSLGCALLLTALWYERAGNPPSRAMALWYALAVAAKTFPLFVVPKLLATGRDGAVCVIGALILVLGLLSLPHVATPRPYFTDIVLYDTKKLPRALSWQQVLLHVTSQDGARLLSYFFLALFAVAACWLLRITDLPTYCLLVLLLFILLSKVVLEQNLVWPMPWLILQAIGTSNIVKHPRPANPQSQRCVSIALLAVLTTVGVVVNPYVHPFGQSPAPIAGMSPGPVGR